MTVSVGDDDDSQCWEEGRVKIRQRQRWEQNQDFPTTPSFPLSLSPLIGINIVDDNCYDGDRDGNDEMMNQSPSHTFLMGTPVMNKYLMNTRVASQFCKCFSFLFRIIVSHVSGWFAINLSKPMAHIIFPIQNPFRSLFPIQIWICTSRWWFCMSWRIFCRARG